MFTDIFDIKKANYIPKPEISPYNQFIKNFNRQKIMREMAEEIFELAQSKA